MASILLNKYSRCGNVLLRWRPIADIGLFLLFGPFVFSLSHFPFHSQFYRLSFCNLNLFNIALQIVFLWDSCMILEIFISLMQNWSICYTKYQIYISNREITILKLIKTSIFGMQCNLCFYVHTIFSPPILKH